MAPDVYSGVLLVQRALTSTYLQHCTVTAYFSCVISIPLASRAGRLLASATVWKQQAYLENKTLAEYPDWSDFALRQFLRPSYYRVKKGELTRSSTWKLWSDRRQKWGKSAISIDLSAISNKLSSNHLLPCFNSFKCRDYINTTSFDN